MCYAVRHIRIHTETRENNKPHGSQERCVTAANTNQHADDTLQELAFELGGNLQQDVNEEFPELREDGYINIHNSC